MTSTQIHTRPGMGRSVIQHDEQSRVFPARALFDTMNPRQRTWRRGLPYDQGYTSTCVAQTGKGMLNTLRASGWVDYDQRSQYSIDEFYRGAQQLDEWPGENYDGTSGLGLCKYLMGRGLLKEYRWCFGLQDVLLTLSHVGPVGLGVWWYSGMMTANWDGFISPTGQQEGGHEVELIGVNPTAKYVIGMNSWGVGWGQQGRFKLSFDDLERLLHEQGDAFVMVS